MADYTPMSIDQMEDILNPLGFVSVSLNGVKERVYEKRYGHRRYIRVYTSIVGSTTRDVGKDAIKIVAVAKWNNQDHFISGSKRINRVGMLSSIAARIRDRIRSLEDLAPEVVLDSRGFPMTLRKNRRDGSLFWGQPDWSKLAPADRETKPYRKP